MERMRRRIAFAGVVALALCVTAGLSAGAVEAKHKKKNKNPGGLVDTTKQVNAQVPDATLVGSTFHNGVLASTIDVPAARPFIGTLVRDVNVTLQTTGNTPETPTQSGSASDLSARLTAPNGATAWLFLGLSGQSIGPLTIDDDVPVYVGGSSPSPSPYVLTAPYAGTAQPSCAFSFGGCPMRILNDGPATGTWTLRVYDQGPTASGDPPVTSVLNNWRLTMVAGSPYRTK
jgi:hypothetical protein